MLLSHVLVDTDQPTFEDAKVVLDGVSVDEAPDVLASAVSDYIVTVKGFFQALVGPHVVGDDVGVLFHLLLKDRLKG